MSGKLLAIPSQMDARQDKYDSFPVC